MYFHNGHSAAAVALVEERPQGRPQPVTRAAEDGTRVMIVSPFDEDLVSLLEILSHANWSVYWLTNCAEAIAMLHAHTVPVVLCDRDLPDGNWQSLLPRVNSLAEQARLIVTARLADERLWAEALNLGAYDVLAKPFDAGEVVRVVGYACYCSPRAHEAKEGNRHNWRLTAG